MHRSMDAIHCNWSLQEETCTLVSNRIACLRYDEIWKYLVFQMDDDNFENFSLHFELIHIHIHRSVEFLGFFIIHSKEMREFGLFFQQSIKIFEIFGCKKVADEKKEYSTLSNKTKTDCFRSDCMAKVFEEFPTDFRIQASKEEKTDSKVLTFFRCSLL